jgi:arginyl-tRNA synthetase
VEEGIKDGHFFQKEDGSVWIDLTEAGLDEKNLIRSNGTTGYITQDIGVADVKYQDFAMDRSVYVVADEQNYHFRVLFEILAKLGRPYVDGLYHFSYGMVDLTTGKMKSREGTTVDADDLVADVIAAAEAETQSHKEEMGKIAEMSEDELAELYRILGLGALKFYLLKVDPKKRMIFDPVESVALRGDTAPYVQYAYARVQSILRKAAEMEGIASFSAGMRREEPLHEAEITVLRRIYDYRRILKEAADSYNLSLFANFSLDLARDLNRFYHECKVLNPDQPVTSAFRLALSGFAGETIRQAMTILGIEVPDRM